MNTVFDFHAEGGVSGVRWRNADAIWRAKSILNDEWDDDEHGPHDEKYGEGRH